MAAIFTIALAAFIGVFLIQRQTKPSVIQPSQADSASKETPQPPPESNPIHEIAFVRNGDIYICTRNGENLKRLTTDGKNAFPLWSFNGEWIAFLKAEPPVRGIAGTTLCVINVDDGGVRRLITEGGASLYPVSWLPDDSGVIYNFTQLETEGLPGRFGVVRLDGSKIIWAPWSDGGSRLSGCIRIGMVLEGRWHFLLTLMKCCLPAAIAVMRRAVIPFSTFTILTMMGRI